MLRMRLPETQLRPVERAKASSMACPTASRKATCECTKRCDHSSVKVAMRSDLHGASVAQVPATATMQRQTPTSTAQSRRPLVAAITATEAAHPVHVEAKKAAAASVVTICIGQVLLASPYPKTCQLPRAARQKLCICMLGRGSMLTDWLGARTWDLDLPPLMWGRRRRCTRSLRRMTSSTPRTRHLNTPNFCE